MNTSRSPLGGKQISKARAYEDLGDPKTWAKESKFVMADLHRKPTRKFSTASVLNTMARAAKKLPAAVGGFIKVEAGPEAVFAKARHVTRRKVSAKRSRPKTRHKSKPKKKS
jgi:hypothetical protein